MKMEVEWLVWRCVYWLVACCLLPHRSQATRYYFHHHCNKTLLLGSGEVGQVLITSELPEKQFRHEKIGDCVVTLRTSFSDERVRMSQRPTDKTRYETGEVSVTDGPTAATFPFTSTTQTVTIDFQVLTVQNLFAVAVTIDFSVIGDPWMFREQLEFNKSILIAILVILIVSQLVVVILVLRAAKSGAAPDEEAKPSKQPKKVTNSLHGDPKLSTPSLKPKTLKDMYPHPAPKMTKNYSAAAAKKGADDYYLKNDSDEEEEGEEKSAPVTESKESLRSRTRSF